MSSQEEKVLCVDANCRFMNLCNKQFQFSGYTFPNYTTGNIIEEMFLYNDKEFEFVARKDAEGNHDYKQIIPYVIFRNNSDDNKLFVMKRKDTSDETRLHNLYSIGLGGHINSVDCAMGYTSVFIVNILRELSEETNFDINNVVYAELIGFINDNETDVGKDHFGVVYSITYNGDIDIKEVDKLESCGYMTFNELKDIKDNLENWSKIVYDNLSPFFLNGEGEEEKE